MRRAAELWDRVLFRPESSAPYALLRIVVGTLVVGWGISLIADVDSFFGDPMLGRAGSHRDGRWTLLTSIDHRLMLAVLIAGGCSLVVGWHSRFASILVFAAMSSFNNRNPWVANGGDNLLTQLTLFVALAPSGAALSLDARRRHGSAWVFPLRAPWVRRIVQVHMTMLYVATSVAKLRGTNWVEGTAVGYALGIEDFARFSAPDFFVDWLPLVTLATVATLAIEVSLATLVWVPRLRPWVLAAGVGLHVSIDVFMRIGFFSLAAIALYISMLDPGAVERRLLSLRRQFGRRWGGGPVPSPAWNPSSGSSSWGSSQQWPPPPPSSPPSTGAGSR